MEDRGHLGDGEMTKERDRLTYLGKTTTVSFEEALLKVRTELQKEEFAVLTDIDVRETFKSRIFREFRNYKILCACIPRLMYRALNAEDRIGTNMLCNVIVEELDSSSVEVSALDPLVWSTATENPDVREVAAELRVRLEKAFGRI